jgi:hypothetical protein
MCAAEDLEHRSLMDSEAFRDDWSWNANDLHSPDRSNINIIEMS